MTDGQIVIFGAVIFWLVVALWIKATDPLAGPFLRVVWAILGTILKVVGVGLLFLALTGLSRDRK